MNQLFLTQSRTESRLNPLPNDNILRFPTLKAFADNNIDVPQPLKFVLRIVAHVLGKGENAGYQHYLLCPQYSQKIVFFFRVIKT